MRAIGRLQNTLDFYCGLRYNVRMARKKKQRQAKSRARKTSTLATRVYRYGCLPPTENAAAFEEQLWRAHQYRRVLAKIEVERRRKVEGIEDTWSADVTLDIQAVLLLQAEFAQVKEAQSELERTIREAKKARSPTHELEAEHLVNHRKLEGLREALRSARAAVLAQAREQLQGRPLNRVGTARVNVAAAKDDLHAARQMLRAKRAGSGKLADVTAERAAVEAAKQMRKAAWETLRDARTALYALPNSAALKCVLQACDDEAGEAIRAARSQCGLAFGTYLKVEEASAQSIKEAFPDLPRVPRWDGSGKAVVQLIGGMTVAELFGGEDTRLRVGKLPDDVWTLRRHHRRKATRTTVRLRIGSTEKRQPIFVTLPVIFHRPLPDDANIKWAWILKQRMGPLFNYSLQLVVESAAFAQPEAPIGAGTVAINLGWRRHFNEDGEVTAVRVAYWRDDAGNHGEILVPDNVRRRIDYCDRLRAIRDAHFDFARAWFTNWLRSEPTGPQDVADMRAIADARMRLDAARGDDVAYEAAVEKLREAKRAATCLAWLRDATVHMANWKKGGPRKLASLVAVWRRDRPTEHASMLAALEAWAAKDRHLHLWETHQRDRAQNHRREVYRLTMRTFAQRYATILIGEFDLTDPKVAERKADEDGVPSEGRAQRRTKARSAPGELRDALRAAAYKTGAAIIESTEKLLTQRCHVCGATTPWDAKPEILHTCVACSSTWDQDDNHCWNLLASGLAPTSVGEPLAGSNDAEDRRNLAASTSSR